MICVCAPTMVNSSARAFAPLAIERRRPARNRELADKLVGHHLGVLQELPHPHLERGVRQLARVLQSLAHLQLEPAIDAAIDELQGEVIDHQDRARRPAR